MTQKSTERRSSSGQFTWVWMVASVLAVGAFMYWLGATAEPTAPPVVEAEEEELDAPGAATVGVDALVAGLDSYVGTEVRLEAIPVASRLGSQAFWTTTSAGVPLLVRLAPSLVADSFAVAGGETVTVVGAVRTMSDSVLSAWQQEGVLEDENQRMEAEFATGFVEARLAQRVEAPAEPQSATQE